VVQGHSASLSLTCAGVVVGPDLQEVA
jgi:hypothetical protein